MLSSWTSLAVYDMRTAFHQRAFDSGVDPRLLPRPSSWNCSIGRHRLYSFHVCLLFQHLHVHSRAKHRSGF